jgi:hypothetical protein
MPLHLIPPRVDVPPPIRVRATPPPVEGELSRAEVGFLLAFMDASIMVVEVRWALRKAWGFCPRHVAAWLQMEAAFRHHYLHGPAVLYDDLMTRACAAFDLAGLGATRRLAGRLRAHSPCYVCALGIDERSDGYVREGWLAIARDPGAWQRFAEATRAHWADDVCGTCAGSASPRRCRAHLADDLAQGRVREIEPYRADVERIAAHLRRYHDSFSWDKQGTDTLADRAALVSAAGWCSGWQGLLALAGSTRR